jgi:hypothetical protein
MISEYWKTQGKTEADKKIGRTWRAGENDLRCDECCNGDNCDDPTHYRRSNCPYCLGTGVNASTKIIEL